jgi:hypothetical protein
VEVGRARGIAHRRLRNPLAERVVAVVVGRRAVQARLLQPVGVVVGEAGDRPVLVVGGARMCQAITVSVLVDPTESQPIHLNQRVSGRTLRALTCLAHAARPSKAVAT